MIVTGISEQERVVGALRNLFPGATLVDRRSEPSYGYRAVHVIVETNERVVEVQIRTVLQHLWAELSEKFSDVVDPAIKYGGGEKEIQELLLERSHQVSRTEELERKMLDLGQQVPEEITQGVRELKLDMARSLAELKAMVGRLDRRRR